LNEIQRALLDAAVGATREQMLRVECPDCGRRHWVSAQMPDVRARVSAIELLLREGLGRAPRAEEPATPRLPETAAGIESMSWQDMQYFAATLLVDELMAVQRDGGEALLRDRVAELDDQQRRVLCRALADTAA
jgi:hypothetical protein